MRQETSVQFDELTTLLLILTVVKYIICILSLAVLMFELRALCLQSRDSNS
jgi:hypothetical protein